MTMSEEDKLTSVRLTLMRSPKFLRLSGVMMMGATYITDDINTAATNGRDEWYGRKFIQEFSKPEVAFTVMHENLHKAARHLLLWANLYEEDPYLANVACDHWINLTLTDLDPMEEVIAFPRRNGKRFGCYDPRFREPNGLPMDTLKIFRILKAEQEQQQQQKGQGQPGSNSGSNSGGFDSHDWDGAKELSKEEREKLSNDIDRALRQGAAAARRAGVGSASDNKLFGELVAPKVDWRVLLRQWVSTSMQTRDSVSWRKLNRRYITQDVYLPSMVGEKVRCIGVGVDASGSTTVSKDMLAAFLSEVVSIAEDVAPEQLHLVYWDTAVTRHEVYGQHGAGLGTLRSSTKPVGGGGTDAACVPAFLRKQGIDPECVIMLTDGCCSSWGNWSMPVLWVNCGTNTVPVGQTIHISI